MKIICLQENLKEGLNIVQNITGKNLTLPILNNILLITEKGKLKLSTTDLEIAITSYISCKVEKQGSITIPAKTFVNFINNLPNKKIEINIKNNTAYLKCDNYKSSIKGLDAKDFPIIPKIKTDNILEVSSLKFKDALEQIINFVSFSDIRPEITGVLFNFSLKNKLKLVATDSFRLGEKLINIKFKNTNLNSVIIPHKTIQELIRIISNQKDDEVVKINIDDNQILFNLNNAQLISKIIEGSYPSYQQLISQQFETSLSINKEEFVKAIKISSFFSSKINDVRFKIKKSSIEIFSQDIELGENLTEMKNIQVKGKDLEITFNHRYILDGLNSINSKKIFLGFNGESSPGIIKPEGDNTFIYVAMPIKL